MHMHRCIISHNICEIKIWLPNLDVKFITLIKKITVRYNSVKAVVTVDPYKFKRNMFFLFPLEIV